MPNKKLFDRIYGHELSKFQEVLSSNGWEIQPDRINVQEAGTIGINCWTLQYNDVGDPVIPKSLSKDIFIMVADTNNDAKEILEREGWEIQKKGFLDEPGNHFVMFKCTKEENLIIPSDYLSKLMILTERDPHFKIDDSEESFSEILSQFHWSVTSDESIKIYEKLRPVFEVAIWKGEGDPVIPPEVKEELFYLHVIFLEDHDDFDKDRYLSLGWEIDDDCQAGPFSGFGVTQEYLKVAYWVGEGNPHIPWEMTKARVEKTPRIKMFIYDFRTHKEELLRGGWRGTYPYFGINDLQIDICGDGHVHWVGGPNPQIPENLKSVLINMTYF